MCACSHVFACACVYVYVYTWVFVSAHVCMFIPLFVCMSVCVRYMCVFQMYGKMYSRHEEAEGGVSGLVSSFQMAPDITLHPALWLLRSLSPETRELSSGTKWASLAGEGGKILPEANRIMVMLGSLEPAGPCLILKECVQVPTQQSRPQPD